MLSISSIYSAFSGMCKGVLPQQYPTDKHSIENAVTDSDIEVSYAKTSSTSAARCLEQLQNLSSKDLENNQQARNAALETSRRLSTLLTDPIKVTIEASQGPVKATAVRMALDLDLFRLLANSHENMSTVSLAKASNGSPQLLKRVLRMLNSTGFVDEADRDLWAPNGVTRAMAQLPIAAGYRWRWDIMVAGTVQAPAYFRERSHKCPDDPNNGILQYAHHTDHNVFEYLDKVQPERLHDFNLWMGHTSAARSLWTDWYPAEKRLLQEARGDRPLLVDIAGGKGHDIQAFHNKFPDAQGRLILQDLAQAFVSVSDGALDPSIEKQVHDFFKPNPVHGTRAYFLHHVLHDWSDHLCVRILTQIREVMDPAYSKLLIHELILPEQGATEQQAFFDFHMMVFNAGKERTATEWTELLQLAGFGVEKIWYSPEGSNVDGLIEAVIR